MSFSVHTFETNTQGNLGFAFHHTLGEGQDLYFLAKFSTSIKNPEAVAESIFGAAVDYFDESEGVDAYHRFEEGLKKANKAAKELGQDFNDSIEILIAFFDFHHLYLSQSGQSEAYLLRNGNVSQISELPEEGDDLFINILNGQISIDDVVVFASHRILRSITANQLSDIFTRPNFGEAVNILRHDLSSKSDEDILVTVIGVGKKEKISAAGFLSKVIAKKDELLKSNDEAEPEEISQKSDEFEEEKSELISEELYADLEDPIENFEKDSPSQTHKRSVKGFQLQNKIPYIAGASIILIALAIWFWLSKETPTQSVVSAKESGTGNVGFWWSIGILSLLIVGAFYIQFKDKLKSFLPNKNLLVIIPTVLGLILVGIFINSIVSSDSQEEIRLRDQLSIARENLHQADSFLLQGDKDSAKENLTRAEKSAQMILKSKYFRSDAQFILADIDKKKLQVENAHNANPKLVADLSAKNENLESIGLLELRGNLYAYDSKSVHKTIRNVVEKGLPITENSTVLAATSRPDQNLLLFLTNDPQIIEYKEGTLTPMRTQDEKWKSGIDIKTYGRYSYVLDPTENQIWKYERKRANYSGAIPYNQGADLSRSVSFAIDGAIYVLSDDGNLQKIFRGEQVDYSFRELPSLPITGKNLKIYTSADLDFLYVLDPDNGRILIFVKGDKFATYKKQVLFEFPDAAIARDFKVNDSGQKVNILTKDEIYEFAL